MNKYLGKHVLLELWNCDLNILNDINKIESLMLKAAEKANVTVVEKCFHQFSPYGVSGVVVIAESHIAIHTWPEHKYAAVDFFTCNKNTDTNIVVNYLKENFKSQKIDVKIFKRG